MAQQQGGQGQGLFGPPLHEPPTRFNAPPSFHAQHHTPSAFLYGNDDDEDEHHDRDHSHDHHDGHSHSHSNSKHHDHEHSHDHHHHDDDHDDHHDHDHHDHSHDDHHDHDHHDHSGHSHSHSHSGHNHNNNKHSSSHSSHSTHHASHATHDDHHHDHSGHSHSHGGGGGGGGYAKNSMTVSQRNSPSLGVYQPSPSFSSGPGINVSSEDILQPSNQGYVFTAKANDGWVADDDRWHNNYQQEGEAKTKASLAHYMKLIWIDKDAKNLFMFIILSTSFTFIEIMYGASYNSLGLISEAFHTIFDNIAMVISLIALLLSRHEPNSKFSYGYDRIEILSGFANGAFLLFVSFFLFVESVERILEPPELHSHGRVISIAFIGLLINAAGIVFFSRQSLHRSEHRERTSARQDNMSIIMQHLFTDMLSGIGVIISSWLSQMNGWHIADTIISLLIAILIVRNAWPICSKTARVLLLTTPDSKYSTIIQCLREASTLEGVLEYHSEHFWTQAPGIFVGSLCVKVRSDANEQSVLQQVTKLFAPHIRHLTVQIEKDNWNL